MTSNLILHRGGRVVSRDELAAVPTPAPTPTWRPVAHIDLVRALADRFADSGVAVTREQLGIGRGGRLLFGVFDLSIPGGEGDYHAAFGFRAANDKSLAIRAVAGARVVVCDNLLLSGSEIVLSRKHTSGLRLGDEAAAAVARFHELFPRVNRQVEAMKARPLADGDAKRLLYDIFASRALPLRLLPTTHGEYFSPRQEQFPGRTLWRLHNALTESAKALPLGPRMAGLTRIGRTFDSLLN